ncbi:MAG: transcriptional regulator [Firmicutes bacterium HGW-Firmicutes-13]|nr:MAG: transcriptional regulator [Firmicutes bacterium HGW-Firmicutes-13]
MQFYQLQAFTKVAERKSFSRAAEDIYLSQSTVSSHISSLEKHFGQKLFDRLGKEVVLTPFGERFYYWSTEILKLRDMANWDLKDWTGIVEGNIHIGAGTVPAQFMAPFLISEFIKKYPGISFTLTQNSSEIVAEDLLKGVVDMGILGEKYYSEKIEYIPFLDEKLVLITPRNFKLKEPVSLYQVLDYNFVFRKPGSGTQAVVEKIFKKEGIESAKLNVVAYFNNVQSIKQGVKEGLGISIISEIAAMDYAQSKYINKYELKEIGERRTFYFAYNRQKTLAPFINEFIKFSTREGIFP